MIAPHSLEDFFSAYFEQTPLHVDRNDQSYFAGVYSVADVEDALTVGARDPENFALVKFGNPEVSVDAFTYERPSARWRTSDRGPAKAVDARKVIGCFADGYTLIVNDAALFNARLQRFSNRIQRELLAYCQANVYLTPPAAQGFQIHHDSHDTLTAQIEGEKTWRIYKPLVALPLEAQPFDVATNLDNVELVREVHLRPGDTLYIPRGYLHEAKTSSTQSLHITFALAPIRVAEVLDFVSRIASVRDVELRRALRPSMVDADGFPERFGQFFESRLTATFSGERVESALDGALYEMFRITRPNTNGAFEQALRCANITDGMRLRIDDGVPFMIRDRQGAVDLLIAGKSIEFPAFCKAAILQIQQGPVTVAELDPALSPEHRNPLIRLLVLEGLVLIDET